MGVYRGIGSAGETQAASTSADEAAASAAEAELSATAASDSTAAAAASEAAAAASEAAAAASETAASDSETAAAASEAAAAASYDSFDDRYLGSKASDPTLDNDGNALLTGALYWNSTNDAMRVYNGSSWVDVGSSTANVTTFTATTGQTTFSGLDDDSLLLSYTPGYLYVYLNGVLLKDTTDYVATDGTSIVLTTGAVAGDVLQGLGFGTFDVSTSYTTTESDALFQKYTDELAPKDYIINGQFHVWHRGTNFTNVQNADFMADRWRHQRNGSGATVTCVKAVPPLGATWNTWGSSAVMQLACTVAGTGETYHDWQQKIEGVARTAGRTLTLSMTAKSYSGSDYTMGSIFAVQRFGTGGSPSSTVTTAVAVTPTIDGTDYTRQSWTFTLPSISGKTLGTNGDDCLDLVFRTGQNETYALYIAEVSLVEGTVTPDVQSGVDPGDVLHQCQRFYEKSYPQEISPGTITGYGMDWVYLGNFNVTTHAIGSTVYFKVEKRGSPTVDTWSTATASTTGKAYDYTATADVTATVATPSTSGFRWSATCGSSSGTMSVAAQWTADAEL